MGQVNSIINRKKSPDEVKEQLELLKKDRNITERDILTKKITYKRTMRVLRISYTYIAIFFIILLYYMYDGLNRNWLYWFIFASPLIVFAIVLYFGVIQYYKWVIQKYTQKLNKTMEDTDFILEEVKTTETYAVAKDMLDEYSSTITVDRPSSSHHTRANYDNVVEWNLQ